MSVVGHLACRDEVAFLHDVTGQCAEMYKKRSDDEQYQEQISLIVHV